MLETILEVYEKILRLKELRRTGWMQRGIPEPESVASHSFAVTLLAVLLADIRGLDPADAARIALIHDLPESVTGDLTPQMKKDLENFDEQERAAIKELAEKLPEPAASRILNAWTRYQRRADSVARLVRDADKLEMGLQALAYVEKGYRDALEIYESALREIEDEELKRLLREAGGHLT